MHGQALNPSGTAHVFKGSDRREHTHLRSDLKQGARGTEPNRRNRTATNRTATNRANREPNRTNPSLQTEPNRDLDLYCCYYA